MNSIKNNSTNANTNNIINETNFEFVSNFNCKNFLKLIEIYIL